MPISGYAGNSHCHICFLGFCRTLHRFGFQQARCFDRYDRDNGLQKITGGSERENLFLRQKTGKEPNPYEIYKNAGAW